MGGDYNQRERRDRELTPRDRKRRPRPGSSRRRRHREYERGRHEGYLDKETERAIDAELARFIPFLSPFFLA